MSAVIKSSPTNEWTYMFIKLMNTEFCKWPACPAGIIDAEGNLIKLPKTPEEKEAYTPFHAAVRAVKRTIDTCSSDNEYVKTSWNKLASKHGLYADRHKIGKEVPCLEDMVAGDAGYTANNIASGVTSGDVVNAGPDCMPTKKKKVRAKIKPKK